MYLNKKKINVEVRDRGGGVVKVSLCKGVGVAVLWKTEIICSMGRKSFAKSKKTIFKETENDMVLLMN